MTERTYLIYQIKKMADDLGRAPLQDEFCMKFKRYYVIKYFGTYNELLKVAGLETNKENVGRKKNIRVKNYE